MDIPNKYLICDIRSSKDLNGGTISGYKKRDVVNAFQNSIINNKIEEAKCRGVPGIEPGTSRTLSENHTTRPHDR